MLPTPPVTLAVCTNFLPEAQALVGRGELENITLTSWDAACQCPAKTWEEIAHLFEQKDKSTKPLVIIGSCFSHSLPSRPEFMKHIHLVPLEQCFELICDKEILTSLTNEESFLTSSGWLKSWRTTLADWGFDQPLARQFFHDTSNKIILLDTGIYPDAVTELESFAAYVNLPCQHIRIGLDHFSRRVSAILNNVRGEYLQKRLLLNEEKLAQYELSLSLLDRLTDSQTEQDAIAGLVDIFHTLFAPRHVHFHRHLPSSAGSDVGSNDSAIDTEFLPAEKHQILERNKFLLHQSLDGFWLVLKSGTFIAGYLNITRIHLSEHLHRYLNLALAIAPLCAVAVSRGRFAEQRQKDMIALQLDIIARKKTEDALLSSRESLRIQHEKLEQANRELKQAHAQQLQSEKMASIGQLAAGVAHEINNPIGFVSSNLGSLERYLGKLTEFITFQDQELTGSISPELHEKIADRRNRLKINSILEDIGDLLAESRNGVDRVGKIVSDLKGFSRVDEAEHKTADIIECLESSINIVWNEIKYKATLSRDFADLPKILCYPGQLNQVFVNLLINAAQAIKTQGTIELKAWATEDHIYVRITDSGCGISEEDVPRIFDPFFTTKEVGKGTGLGLSISYDIIKKHQGEISVESQVEKGTSLTIKLPSNLEESVEQD